MGVLGQDRPAESGLDLKALEEVLGDQLSPDELRVPPGELKAQGRVLKTDERLKPVALPEVSKVGIAELPGKRICRSGRVDRDDLAGIRNRERFQKKRVHQAEDRRGGADPES